MEGQETSPVGNVVGAGWGQNRAWQVARVSRAGRGRGGDCAPRMGSAPTEAVVAVEAFVEAMPGVAVVDVLPVVGNEAEWQHHPDPVTHKDGIGTQRTYSLNTTEQNAQTIP